LEQEWLLRRKFQKKVRLVYGSFIFLSLIVLLWVLDLQVTKENEIAEKIKSRFDRIVPIRVPLYRGSIKDVNGKELAISVPTIVIYAHPDTSHLRNREKFISELSRITGIKESVLRERVRSGSAKPIRLAWGIDRRLKPKIKRLILETGNSRYVGIQEEYTRLYPNGTLASNLIGFVGVDGKGLEGLEYALNKYLGGGFANALIYLNGGLGRIYLHPLRGMLGQEKDVVLTLDLGVQNILEKVRDRIVKRWRPKKVSILLMDARNGDILGIATYPYFDPNNFKSFPPSARRNFAVTDVFEPGSIMKPLFVGMALEKGYVSEGFTVNAGKGRIRVYERYVRDPRRLGRINLRDILVYSSNIGTIKVASYLTQKDVEDLFRRFHLHQKFGIFPGEASPQIPDFVYPANILYASIGQGLALNTLNIAVAFAGIATGNIPKPRIVKGVVSPEGDLVHSSEEEILTERVFSERVQKWLRKSLTLVVERGTGVRAKSRYFTIAGKTGTSQKFDKKLGRYSRDKVVTYFAGFFPATDPRFVAVIVVDEPKGKNLYGGRVSAPYFRELAESVAFYYGLKPDKIRKR
jgi:cell division protein FtsI (penicillin-binding protein 3)